MAQAQQTSQEGVKPVSTSFSRAISFLCAAIDSALARRFWICVAVFTAVFLACSISIDLRMKMWIDELYTLIMAQQAGAIQIVKATWEGCDGMPPLYAILVHAILPLMPSQELAVRLPATLGFCAMILSLSAFCRNRMPASYAMTATLVACIMGLDYAVEGRGYGLILGCAAGALLCWQLALDGRHRPLALSGFAFCTALMIALHYYAIFFLVPFLIVEAVRSKTSRPWDAKLLLAMAPAAAVLLLHVPLIAVSAKFEKHYWSPATWKSVILSLGDSDLWIRTNFILPFLLLFVVASAAGKDRLANLLRRTLRLREWLALGIFLLLPPLIAVASMATTHVFVSRYVLWVIPALAVVFVALVCAAENSASVLGVAFLGFFLALAVNDVWTRLAAPPLLRQGGAVSAELAALPPGRDPIVIADHHVFMELSHYAAPPLRDRLLYLVSADLDLRYLDNDTGAMLMEALRKRTALHIEDLDKGLADHRHFFVAAEPSDYLPAYLASAGWRVTLLHGSDHAALYEVVSAPHAPAVRRHEKRG